MFLKLLFKDFTFNFDHKELFSILFSNIRQNGIVSIYFTEVRLRLASPTLVKSTGELGIFTVPKKSRNVSKLFCILKLRALANSAHSARAFKIFGELDQLTKIDRLN